MDDYPLLGALLTVLWLFLLIAWISVLISVLRDIFRSRDLSGAGKAAWTLLVVILPWLGVLFYLVARGHKMQENELDEAARREEALQQYIRATVAQSPTTSPTGEAPTDGLRM